MYLYAKFCPVASATQVVGDFWTPLIVRELLYGTGQFNQLARNLPGISRTILTARLRSLQRAGVIEREPVQLGKPAAYRLTESGRELEPVVNALSKWGLQWGTPNADSEDLDGMVAICMLKSRIHGECLPKQRVVLEVFVPGEPPARGWLVCERNTVSMCFENPGFEVDLNVTGEVDALYQIWLQKLSFSDALRTGRICVEGRRELVRSTPGWFDA